MVQASETRSEMQNLRKGCSKWRYLVLGKLLFSCVLGLLADDPRTATQVLESTATLPFTSSLTKSCGPPLLSRNDMLGGRNYGDILSTWRRCGTSRRTLSSTST